MNLREVSAVHYFSAAYLNSRMQRTVPGVYKNTVCLTQSDVLSLSMCFRFGSEFSAMQVDLRVS